MLVLLSALALLAATSDGGSTDDKNIHACPDDKNIHSTDGWEIGSTCKDEDGVIWTYDGETWSTDAYTW